MGSCPGPSLGHCWWCQLASPRLGSLHHALSVAPRHQGCSMSRLSQRPASTHPTAVQSRLWAMPVPLTAPLTRGLRTWPQISPEVSSPFSVGDVSQTLVFPFWSISRCSCLSWTQSPNITPVLGRAWGTCLAYRLHS